MISFCFQSIFLITWWLSCTYGNVQVAAHSIHLTSFVDDYDILWYDYGNDMWTSSEQGKVETQITGISSNMWPSLEDYIPHNLPPWKTTEPNLLVHKIMNCYPSDNVWQVEEHQYLVVVQCLWERVFKCATRLCYVNLCINHALPIVNKCDHV
jgi:hypothetical protein